MAERSWGEFFNAGLFIGALATPDSRHPDLPAATLKTLELAAKHVPTARRIHDARHAATATVNGVSAVYTYDPDDWNVFSGDGLSIIGPTSPLARQRTP